jgi:MFS family permease
VFVQFFSTSIGMLCAGEILGGLAYGFYVVIAPTYASEICPLALRGVLTASVNLAFVIGQFIAQGCAAGVESRLDEWAYKAPFVSFGSLVCSFKHLWKCMKILGQYSQISRQFNGSGPSSSSLGSSSRPKVLIG